MKMKSLKFIPWKHIFYVLPGILLFALAILCWLHTPADISVSERRKLSQKPELSQESLLSGQYMQDFDAYSMDQFPDRDGFRSLQSMFQTYALGAKDVNDVYWHDGYSAKLDYPLQENSLNYALSCFQSVYENYLKGTHVSIYASVVPDKGYFLAEPTGHPSMDYEKLLKEFAAGMSFSHYISLTNTLHLTDYYKTDSHWRQEKIIPVAQHLLTEMGHSQTDLSFTQKDIGARFQGVYANQSALPTAKEPIYYLTNDLLDRCQVWNAETNETTGIYTAEKLSDSSGDPYDFFLSGACPLLTIENPSAQTDRELVIFRDSFSSSLAPLLMGAYQKVTLVDLRYLSSSFLSEFITFDHQDVLFLYSTTLLNNSYTLK